MSTIDAPRLGDLTRPAMQDLLSLDATRWFGLLSQTGLPSLANQQFLVHWPNSVGAPFVRRALETKAAVGPGTSTDPAWAAGLVMPKALEEAFIAFARSASLLGRIGGLHKVPFATNIPVETAGANYVWVPENAPKPASAMAFANTIKLGPTKCAAIIVVTRELVSLAVGSFADALRSTLVSGLTAFTDRSFLDPANAAIAGTRPASITNGTTPITNTGNLAADVQSLLTAFYTARPNAADAVLIAGAGKAAALRTLNGGGGPGLPVLVSDAAVGNIIVALDPDGLFVADSGVAIDMSTEAAIQMDSAPDSPPTAATVPVSLFQHNLAGFRVERFVNWFAVAGAVKYLA